MNFTLCKPASAARPRAIDRTGVTLDGHYFSRGVHEPRCEHSYISHARTKIQDALPWTNPGFAKESLRNRGETFGLPYQALMLCVSIAKDVVGMPVQRHTIRRIISPLFPGAINVPSCGQTYPMPKALA
jgi:hypothetical protein